MHRMECVAEVLALASAHDGSSVVQSSASVQQGSSAERMTEGWMELAPIATKITVGKRERPPSTASIFIIHSTPPRLIAMIAPTITQASICCLRQNHIRTAQPLQPHSRLGAGGGAHPAGESGAMRAAYCPTNCG